MSAGIRNGTCQSKRIGQTEDKWPEANPLDCASNFDRQTRANTHGSQSALLANKRHAHLRVAVSCRVSESVPVRKLIFFCSADPREDTGAFFRAYHFANVAAKSGLEAEVRLAGSAVDVTNLDTLPASEAGDLIRQKIAESFAAPFEVSL